MHEPLRATSELIGCKPVSTDRFVSDGLQFLGRRTDCICLSWQACDKHRDCWSVSGDGWSGQDDTLPLAIAAAIQSFHAARCEELRSEHGM